MLLNIIAFASLVLSPSHAQTANRDSSRFAWGGSDGSQCLRIPSSNQTPHPVETVNCFTETLTFFQWADPKSKTCIAYNACGVEIKTPNKKFCASKPNPFSQNFPNKGFSWEKCEGIKKGGSTIPFDEKGNFVPACAPDTLYSWQSIETIKKYYSGTADEKHLFNLNGHALYTVRDPIGSFGYGRDSLRLKLKPNTQFILFNAESVEKDCASFKSHGYDTEHSVFVTKGMSEYLLCSDEPVDSWSLDTAGQLSEIKRDKEWIEQHASSGKFDSYERSTNAEGCPWNYSLDVWHGHTDWHKSTLEINIALIQMRVDENTGTVHFRASDTPSLWKHFSTSTPGYFNSYDSHAPSVQWLNRDPHGCLLTDEKEMNGKGKD